MKILNKFITFSALILFTSSCGKGNLQGNNTAVEQSSKIVRKKALAQFSENMQMLNTQIDERLDNIGKGFNSITGLNVERCLENDASQFRLQPSAQVTYEENLSSNQLLNKLGFGIQADIPLHETGVPVTVSPEINYSRESGTSSLARTYNLTIEITKGYVELVKQNPNSEFRFKKVHYDNLKSKNVNFFNLCGDQIVIKQKVKAQLLITTKFIFADAKTKEEFDASLGAKTPPIFGAAKKSKKSNPSSASANAGRNNNTATGGNSTALAPVDSNTANDQINQTLNEELDTETCGKDGCDGDGKDGGFSIEAKAKFNSLSAEVRKNTTISIRAIQLGGTPSQLSKIVNFNCSLEQVNVCDSLFRQFKNYAAKDFPNQLKDEINNRDVNSNNKFYYSDSTKVLYSNKAIVNNENQLINDVISNYSDTSPSFINFKYKIQQDFKSNHIHYIKAVDILAKDSYKNLANDERKLVKETKENAQYNITQLLNLINKCFSDTVTCQKNYAELKKSAIKKDGFYREFNEEFDDIKAWKLISSTEAEWKPPRYTPGNVIFISDRMTGDFMKSSNLRGYSQFFFKYIDTNNNKITSKKFGGISLTTSFRCYNATSDALGWIWFHEISPYDVRPVTDPVVNYCDPATVFACTHNSDLQQLKKFRIEFWAQ